MYQVCHSYVLLNKVRNFILALFRILLTLAHLRLLGVCSVNFTVGTCILNDSLSLPFI